MARRKSDFELIREFKNGNEDSFEELIQRYSTKAFSLATRLTRSEEDAEEVLQDVFVTVYRKIDSFEGKSSFSSWLYRVTVNASFMRLRKKRREQKFYVEDPKPHQPEQEHEPLNQQANEHQADQAMMSKTILQMLELAISKLPEDYRPVFMLRDVDGLTSREVSKILGLSIPAVKSRLHRSRLMVRRRLNQFYQEYSGGVPNMEKMVENS